MRKNRRDNELFTSKEVFTCEGRGIKHPAGIKYYANINVNKTREDLITLIGVDIETNHLTGEMKLLGFYEGNSEDYTETIETSKGFKTKGYAYYTEHHLTYLISRIKYAIKTSKNFAFWNSLDAFQVLRLFILHDYSEEREFDILERYGKISGEYNSKTNEWNVRPVAMVETKKYFVGIMSAIRDSLQFFIINKETGVLSKCWGYNVASVFKRGLEAEADSSKGGRFNWYSKVDEEAHLVDWERFENDDRYRIEIVLKSNELDAKAAMALGYEAQKEFYSIFGGYPVTLISAGSLARSAITAEIKNTHINEGLKGEILDNAVYDDLSSIGIVRHIDDWIDSGTSADLVKDLYLNAVESYSGGMIEAIRYGYAKKGWIADITSAYPASIVKLPDLRGSYVISGEGEPPSYLENVLIFCRGLVNIPLHEDYVPITVKHPYNKETNVRLVGEYYASYTQYERDYITSIGGTFSEETWTGIVTKGELSVLAKVTTKLFNKRIDLKDLGDVSGEQRLKDIINSEYGIQFEAVEIHEEIEGAPTVAGFRAGEFWNPIYAAIITAKTRIILSKAAREITFNGGEPIILMTDSVTWKGNKEDLPEVLKFNWGESGITPTKVLGYFEEPEELKDIVCLGSGRYGYKTPKIDKKTGLPVLDSEGHRVWKYKTKRRGLNVTSLDNPEGITLSSTFNWEDVLELIKNSNDSKFGVTVRALASVGVVKMRNSFNVHDLGRVFEEHRSPDIVVGLNKRVLNEPIDNMTLTKRLTKTSSLHFGYNTFVKGDFVDGTLSKLRSLTVGKTLKSRKQKKRESTRKRQKRFYDNNKTDLNTKRKKKYEMMSKEGFDSGVCRKAMSWSYEVIEEYITNNREGAVS